MEVRSSDGYVNATKICKVAGKEWSNYLQNKQTEEFLLQLESIGSRYELIRQNPNANINDRHTWVHPTIAEDLQRWCHRNRNSRYEADVCARLAREVLGDREVKTPHGPADIVSHVEVIEVKHVSKYLHALGQAIGYSLAFPDKKTRLHLFGTKCAIEKYRSLAEEVCLATGVRVTFEETSK